MLDTLKAPCAGEDRRDGSGAWNGAGDGQPAGQDARLGRKALAMGATASAANRHRKMLPDEMLEDGANDAWRKLRAFYQRVGLVPGEQWTPPGSFESRNRMWGLPGKFKRYRPRLPLGDPPMIWGKGKE